MHPLFPNFPTNRTCGISVFIPVIPMTIHLVRNTPNCSQITHISVMSPASTSKPKNSIRFTQSDALICVSSSGSVSEINVHGLSMFTISVDQIGHLRKMEKPSASLQYIGANRTVTRIKRKVAASQLPKRRNNMRISRSFGPERDQLDFGFGP